MHLRWSSISPLLFKGDTDKEKGDVGGGSGKHVIWERDEGTGDICLVKATQEVIWYRRVYSTNVQETPTVCSALLWIPGYSKNQMDRIPTVR